VPEWKGEDPDCCSILVFDEQGHGDAIQLARYLLLLSERGARVASSAASDCIGSSKGSMAGSISSIVSTARAIRLSDCLSSLPARFKTRLATIPAKLSYLAAETPLWKLAARIGPQGFRMAFAGEAIQTSRPPAARSSCLLREARPNGRMRLISIQKWTVARMRSHYWIDRIRRRFRC